MTEYHQPDLKKLEGVFLKGDELLIKRWPSEETYQKDGKIVVPDSDRKEQDVGWVIMVGMKKTTGSIPRTLADDWGIVEYDQAQVAMPEWTWPEEFFDVGDTVLYTSYGPAPVTAIGDDIYHINMRDVILRYPKEIANAETVETES